MAATNIQVNYTIFINNRFVEIKKIVNFVFFAPPQSIGLTDTFYLCAGDKFMVNVHSFPKQYYSFRMWVNGDNYGLYTSDRIYLSVALWSNALIRIVTYYNPTSYINYTITQEALYGARPFLYFNWGKYTYSSIFYNNNSISCEFKTSTFYEFLIKIYSLREEIAETNYPHVNFRGYNSGGYKLLCQLNFPVLRLTYVRYKSIFIFERPRLVCFVPFAVIRGSVIRCATNQFPFNGKSIKMKIIDDSSFQTMASSNTYLIKIPYLMNQYGRYSVHCEFTYANPISFEIFDLFVSTPLVFMDSTEVFQTIEVGICSNYAPLPQDYHLKSNRFGTLVFLVDNFYLSVLQPLNDGILIAFFIIILSLPVIIITSNICISYIMMPNSNKARLSFVMKANTHRIVAIINRALYQSLKDQQFAKKFRKRSINAIFEKAKKLGLESSTQSPENIDRQKSVRMSLLIPDSIFL